MQPTEVERAFRRADDGRLHLPVNELSHLLQTVVAPQLAPKERIDFSLAVCEALRGDVAECVKNLLLSGLERKDIQMRAAERGMYDAFLYADGNIGSAYCCYPIPITVALLRGAARLNITIRKPYIDLMREDLTRKLVQIFQHACEIGDLAFVEWLVKTFKSVSMVEWARGKTGITWLHRFDYWCTDVFGTPRTTWFDVAFAHDTPDTPYGPTHPLLVCCEHGQLNIAKWLTAKFNFTQADARHHDNYALRKARENGHHDVVEWLIATFALTIT